MEFIKLLGIVIVIAGFALKLDSILIIVAAAIFTGIAGGLGPICTNFAKSEEAAVGYVFVFQ